MQIMSIVITGIDQMVPSGRVTIFIQNSHPLIKLANALPWRKIAYVVMSDIKENLPKRSLRLGRKLQLRTHLGALLLRMITDKSYRQLEEEIRTNAVYQKFCGCDVVPNWRVPDHTKIEEFANRLSPETYGDINQILLIAAKNKRYANPANLDIDSTVQMANIKRPSLISLWEKAAVLADKLKESGIANPFLFYGGTFSNITNCRRGVDLKKVRGIAKNYALYSKGTILEKQECLKKLKLLIEEKAYYFATLLTPTLKSRRPRIATIKEKLESALERLIPETNHFLEKGTYLPYSQDTILSTHQKEVGIMLKQRNGNVYEKKFGRRYQVGRIGGNFLIAGDCLSVYNHDAHGGINILMNHQRAFGVGALKSFVTDRGYHSRKNVFWAKKLQEYHGLEEFFIPARGNSMRHLSEQDRRLYNRRAGVEALIGLAKRGGQLGRSRAHTDKGTLLSGLAAIVGFNLRQFSNHQRKEYLRRTAWRKSKKV